MKGLHTIMNPCRMIVTLAALLLCLSASSQIRSYKIKDGRMYISLDRTISENALDSFIVEFELADIGLKNFLRNNNPDSLVKSGWKINIQNETGIMISKQLEAVNEKFIDLNKFMVNLQNVFPGRNPYVPEVKNFGVNEFKDKRNFVQLDSVVQFFLRGYTKAEKTYLAGSFNGWSTEAQPMKKTDSGWIAYVKLPAGKHWYKFIVDNRWMVDADNLLRENDVEGNTNSVFFKTNHVFRLQGFSKAKQVYLAGSFNGWQPKQLKMQGVPGGWELPVYLAEGTHMYKFVVDGQWQEDPANPNRLDDGAGGFNSVLSIGKPHLFKLDGFSNAGKVMLAGSFNQWRDFELAMRKTSNGWELPFVLGPGNYEYKFIVDGQWIADPGNVTSPDKNGNSFLIIESNYTFRLKGFEKAQRVFIAGDFNGWNPETFPMKKTDGVWEFSLHLPKGKTRYKFIVDGNWILDPANKLWEQNEYGTGNSLVWLE